jgi:hypothetical protein
VIDTAGKIVLPLIYEAVRLAFTPTRYRCSGRGKTGVFDVRKNAEIIPAVYDDVSYGRYTFDQLCRQTIPGSI